MTQGLREVKEKDFLNELEHDLIESISPILRQSMAGHCMRLSNLDEALMKRACERLRILFPDYLIYILDGKRGELTVTATKLIELRNPMPDGSLRPPLLVFIPNTLKTSSEDSFGNATFKELYTGDLYDRAINRLLAHFPSDVKSIIDRILAILKEKSLPWINLHNLLRFFISIKINDYATDAIGPSLFELGLIPDFKLADMPERIIDNIAIVEHLACKWKTQIGRVLDLPVKDLQFKNRLCDFFTATGLEDAKKWTRLIVTDRNYWPLSFDKWPLDMDKPESGIYIKVTGTDIPVVKEEEKSEKLQSLTGQQVLYTGEKGSKQFNVAFTTEPHPSEVPGLSEFEVQIISKDTCSVIHRKHVTLWRTKQKNKKVTFKKLNNISWEEGWYFIRIIPMSHNGLPINILDESGNRLTVSQEFFAHDLMEKHPNYSELFYVILQMDDEEIDLEPLQTSIKKAETLLHAKLNLQFSASGSDPVNPVSKKWLEEKKKKTIEVIEVKFEKEGIFHIPVSEYLKNIEEKILACPEKAISWHLQINKGVPGDTAEEPFELHITEPVREFLKAREKYFDTLKKDNMVSQGLDFSGVRTRVSEYAESYMTLLQGFLRDAESKSDTEQKQLIREIKALLSIDTIFITLKNYNGEHKEAALISPTHPLRALWFTTFAELGQNWLKMLNSEDKELRHSIKNSLLNEIVPVNYPPFLSVSKNRIFPVIDNIHPLWTLYGPAREEDPRGLLSEICSAFSLPEPHIDSTDVTGSYLTSRVCRYLFQHPYISTLTVNAFNPGRGKALADMLISLQKIPVFSDLTYNIRLFVSDTDISSAGEELSDLLSPDNNITTKEAEVFSIPTGDHLYPKLNMALLSIKDFKLQPEKYRAHITILFDIFPPEELSAAKPSETEGYSPLHGLMQDFSVNYTDDNSVVAWTRQVKYGAVSPLKDGEELSHLLSALPEVMSSATGLIATGQTGMKLYPVIKLSLSTDDRALIYQVHEVSDWVFTIDRNMGIEFYDHGGHKDRPDYLIDHSPCITFGHKLVITSRSLLEIEAMLQNALEKYKLEIKGKEAGILLNHLNSLSGRLALKLISSSNQRTEAIGLALAKMYLEYQGALKNQIIVPLDSHLELYHSLQKSAVEEDDEISFKRTDLALFDLNAKNRTITCKLVEVKCYTLVDLTSYNQLKTHISEQIYESEHIWQKHFDPYKTSPDRPDRLLKTKKLVTLLEFYLDRASRLKIIRPDVEKEARYLLKTLEEGYSLAFNRSAFIFDFSGEGMEPADFEGGIEYYRIGKDIIFKLLNNPEDIPSVTQAAFITEERDRTVSQEEPEEKGMADSVSLPSIELQIESDELIYKPHEDDKKLSAFQDSNINKPEETSQERDKKDEMAEQENIEEKEAPKEENPKPECHITLGVNGPSPQYGLLGEVSGRKIALDLNQTHTISLFGVQGGGKSYTLGTIVEMATMPVDKINFLQKPLATVIFHYSSTQDYKPEFTSMIDGNNDEHQCKILEEKYGARPEGLKDIILLTPEDKLEERREEYPSLSVYPLKFSSSELQAGHWRFLMGAVGNKANYIRQLNLIMRSMRNNLTIEGLRQGVENSSLPDQVKELANMRLDLAAQYIDDTIHISSLIRPGRLIIVDLRDEFIEKDEALGLFVVLLQIFSDAKFDNKSFNKLIVFDECHKYIDSHDLVAGLVEVVREMRHKGTSIMVASQDPPSVPISLIELSTQIILHKFNSPAWLKHIQKASSSLNELTAQKMANLKPGEAYVWSGKASDEAFCRGAVRINCRPRVTLHGGYTKTAI